MLSAAKQSLQVLGLCMMDVPRASIAAATARCTTLFDAGMYTVPLTSEGFTSFIRIIFFKGWMQPA
jgi:hypothetical protein